MPLQVFLQSNTLLQITRFIHTAPNPTPNCLARLLALLFIVVHHLLFCLLLFVLLISYISLVCANFLTSTRLFIILFWVSFLLIGSNSFRTHCEWHESVCVRVEIVMRRLQVSRLCYVVIALHLTFFECSGNARLFENISISRRSVFIDQPPLDFSYPWVSQCV